MAKAKMTENSRKVFEYLKAAGAGVKFTTKQVQQDLGFEKSGSVTGLVRKGYAVREKAIVEVEGKEKEVSVFYLTEEGAAFDPDADVEE